jgi:hypothetical protein
MVEGIGVCDNRQIYMAHCRTGPIVTVWSGGCSRHAMYNRGPQQAFDILNDCDVGIVFFSPDTHVINFS